MEEIVNEEWKDIVGYDGKYQISTHGRVKKLESIRMFRNGKPGVLKENQLSCGVSVLGYPKVILSNGSRKSKKYFLVHRLVAQAFIPNIKNDRVVNHLNGIKTDNRVENLEWCSYRENSSHYLIANNICNNYVGVLYCGDLDKWKSHIRLDGKRVTIGVFDTEHEAFEARKARMDEEGIVDKYMKRAT